MTKPISPAPVTDLRPDYLPPYVSNGVIGLRVRDIPLISGVAVLNGLEGKHPSEHIIYTPYAPYPLGGDIAIGPLHLSDVPHHAHMVEQTYDFSCGELTTRFTFSTDVAEARVRVLTFCPRNYPFLVAQEVEVEVDQDCDLGISGQVDPSNVVGRRLPRSDAVQAEQGSSIDGVLLWETWGELAQCGVAYTTEFKGDAEPERKVSRWTEHGPLITEYRFRARQGNRYRLRRIASMVPDQTHHEPDLEAARLIEEGVRTGFDAMRRQNHECWDDLWKGRIKLIGADCRWQALADAAFYYLNSSVHSSACSSSHIFGLARWPNYHYYYGHVMWDVEAFALPSALLTQPHAARAMLDFRLRTIEAARANARLNGYTGLQYPWEASPKHGEEVTPLPGTGVPYEQHSGPGVAYAFAQYADATGDQTFLREQGWPVMSGVADWICSRVTKTERGFEMKHSMGIAERKEPSDNVAYANMEAKIALRRAIDCARRLGYAPSVMWEEVADKLVLPIDPKTHVLYSHDGYKPGEEKGSTPEPLAGIFPLGYDLPKQVEKATLEFYLQPERVQDYIGSPMLSALYGVWAARMGDRALSTRLFDEGYAAFVSDRFMDTHEYREDKFPEQPVAGPFFANLGGFLMGCMYGLPGIKLNPGKPESWCERPVVMPDAWEGIEVERLWIRGQAAHLVARHGDQRATLELSGETIKV